MTTQTALTQLPEWQALQSHFDALQATHLRSLFEQDPQRAERFVAEAVGLYMDYSKHRITSETIDLLLQLANACDL